MSDDLERVLVAARNDIQPLDPALRSRIVASAGRRTGRGPRHDWVGWFAGLVGAPGTAALGMWLGMMQPGPMADIVPFQGSQTAALEAAFADDWVVEVEE